MVNVMNQLSSRLIRLGLALVMALLLLAVLVAYLGQVSVVRARPLTPSTSEQFAISIGDTVSNGVPAPGAGNIEVPGAMDIYTFDGLAGQEVIFNWLSGVNVIIGWQLQTPNSTILFNTFLQDHQLVLPQTGTYTLTVEGNHANSTGLYSFQLSEVPAGQQFAISIGDTVSDGNPTAGAGNLEVPGAVDIYTFDGLAGQETIFNWLSGVNVLIGWQLKAPDNSVLFDTVLQDHQLMLPQTGTYTLTLDGNGIDDKGLYSFQLVDVPVQQQFAINIGTMVSNGNPAPGAGNLEAPGAEDIYIFDGPAGQEIIFDWLSGTNVIIGWQLKAPNSTILFDTVLQDHQLTLPENGSYTLTVAGNGFDDFGLYSFQLLEVPSAPQQFVINVGDTVSNGVPAAGAGNLEAPGTMDIYIFDATMGQKVIFDWLSGNNTQINWQLLAPDSTPLFDTFLADRQLELTQTGSYTLTVQGAGIDDFGSYSFALLEDTTQYVYLPLVIR